MSKRFICVLMALVVMLGVVPVSASGSMTLQEIVDQVIIPMALENDRGEEGYNRFFSYEELAEIVRVLEENGITLPENDLVMQYLTNGCGFLEIAMVEDICAQAFGPSGTWTDEQEGWYDGMIVRLGYMETFVSHVPGKDNMTREEAIAWALKKIREEYGKDLPLEDPEIWQISSSFIKGYQAEDQEVPEDVWLVTLTPKDMEHKQYSAEFNDSNPEETTEVYDSYLNLAEAYTLFRIYGYFQMVYGSYKDWTQSAWQEYHKWLQKGNLKSTDIDYIDYLAFRMTDYPDPKADEITREEAIRIAKEAMTNKRAAYNSAVLTEYEGERAWLVSFVIWTPFDGSGAEDEEAGDYVVSIDSVTGEVQSLRKENSFSLSFCYVPEKAYSASLEVLPKEEDLLPLAVEAVRKEYPEAGDPLDKENYDYYSVLHGDAFIQFNTRNLQHSNIKVRFTQDGKVKDVTMDPPVDGNTLFRRYFDLHGPIGDWDQSVWVQLEKDMENLEPTEVDGKVLKATHYPEEDSVSIKHKEARKLARETTGNNMTAVNSCVLVDAKPHPVWITQLLTYHTLSLVGIDAETGETVLTLPDRADFSPRYIDYSLPEIWRKIEMEEKGPAYMAQAAIIDRVFPADTDWRDCRPGNGRASWRDYCYANEGTAWRQEVDGLTVRWISHREGVDSYEVELDPDGNVIRFEEIKAEK